VVPLLFNTAPEVPALPSPPDGAVSQPLTTTINWACSDSDPGDRLSYRVYFGTDPAPQNNPPALTALPVYDPGPLQLGQTYFWSVTATDAVGASSSGGIWRFSTPPSTPPLVPANPSPGNGAENQPCFLVLGWDGGDPDEGDRIGYDVYFGTQNPPRLVQSNITDTQYAVTFLRPLSTYYWHITARDSSGVETTGPVWHFSTGLLPPECLVETVLGRDNADIDELRVLRDTVLVRSTIGRELIHLYYLLSPSLCRIVRENPSLYARSAEVLARVLQCLRNECGPEAREGLVRSLSALVADYAAADSSIQDILRYGSRRVMMLPWASLVAPDS
jgi:hypothetical protein